MTPALTIVIVSYNCRADLHACLASIRTALPRTPPHIIVVDNQSHDGTPDAVRHDWPGVELVEAGGNVGFAVANNIGLARAQSPFVLLLNPDTIVTPGAIDAMLAWLRAHPDVAIVGPRLVDDAGRPELSFGAMIGPWTELRQKRLVTGHARGVAAASRFVERTTRESKAVDWVSGACLLARREVLAAVGNFDERFFMYTEDVDLCAAVRARGHRVWFLAEAEIVHRRGRSGATAPAATRAAYRRSQLAFYRKHHPLWVPFLWLYLKLRGQ